MMGYKLLITEKGRECDKCRKYHPWSSYSKNKRNKTGHQSRCKLCCSVNAEKYIPRKVNNKKEQGFNDLAQMFILGRFNYEN